MSTQVIDFLKGNPNASKAAISEVTGIKGLQLFNLLKKMQTEGQIKSEGEGNDTTYCIVEISAETQNDEASTNEAEKSPETNIEVVNTPANEHGGEQANKEAQDGEQKGGEQTNQKVTTASEQATPRNNNKFKFNGEEYGKGPLVRAVVAQFVADNPGITYKKLKEAFPDDLLKRFGICQDVEKAREISGAKYDRYFFKEDQVIKVKDKKVVVSNQFTSDNLKPFLKVCKELGYKIK